LKILLTGASGFVGRALRSVLEESGSDVSPVFRARDISHDGDKAEVVICKDIDGNTDWENAFVDIDVVIHLAAKVHVMSRGNLGELAKYREINVEGTRTLAKQAAHAGVKRFVYLSSIKVNGERTSETPFSADQKPQPEDSYAISKLEAEEALREIEKETNMEVVIIRPPLVYGPNVKGNLAALVRMIKKGVPLPLAGVTNRRDLVSIYNLCDLIRMCCVHPAAAGRTFLVSDGEAISTAELIRHLAKGLDRKARLFPVPFWCLRLVASLFGKSEALEKLTGDLQIDISITQNLLGWKPPLTVAESFRMMFTEG
jgi:nucleoside-diphosphate-sugar epimerase